MIDFLVFFEFCSRRVSEQSQIQFYQSYWVQNNTARFVRRTSQKKKPSVADNCLQLQARAFFNDFWIFQLLSKITQMAFTSAGNVVSGSKLVTRLHVQPATLQKQSMRIQTTGQDLDLILTFRITVSRLTRFFTCNQRLSSTVLSSQAHFFQQRCTN